jgi:hypothetical protein
MKDDFAHQMNTKDSGDKKREQLISEKNTGTADKLMLTFFWSGMDSCNR